MKSTDARQPTKWRIAHSGFANTPFVIFAGAKEPNFNLPDPLAGVEVICEVPHDEGPRHLDQKRNAKMIAATVDMYTRLRMIRSELESYREKSDIDVNKLHDLADTGIALAEGDEPDVRERETMKIETVIEALRELVRQIDLSNAVDDHGHELKNLQALADARAILNSKGKA